MKFLSGKNDSFPNKVSISVYNRTTSEADETIKRAKNEGNLPLYRFHDPEKGDRIIDKTSMKGTGKWTVQQADELSIAASTLASSLDLRFRSGLKDEWIAAAEVFKSGEGDILSGQTLDKKKLIDDVRQALYASKICSYARGMN